ncbi:MAG: hypothetical protein ACK53L_04815, partial [Pirellulaceae bacterium]
ATREQFQVPSPHEVGRGQGRGVFPAQADIMPALRAWGPERKPLLLPSPRSGRGAGGEGL